MIDPNLGTSLDAELLSRLAELSPYGALDGPDVAVALGRPLDDPAPLVEHVGHQLGTDDPMVAASIAFQSVTSRVAGAMAMANEALGASIPMMLSTLRWRVAGGQIRLGVTQLAAGAPLDWPALMGRLVADVVEPWAGGVRRHTPIGRRLLWGDAAASLLGATHQSAVRAGRSPAEAVAMGAVALDALPVRGLATIRPAAAGIAYRRTTCCLIDKAPGYGRCGECSLPTV